MYPVRLCLHILPDVLWHDDSRLLVGPSRLVFGNVRFLFERDQASWISQQKVVESASLLKFRGFPIMRTITATTAFKMPLYGINFPLSAFQESSTVLVSSPIPQLSAAKSSLLGNVQIKTERSQTLVFKARPRACFHHARERPARCADTISPGTFHLGWKQIQIPFI